MPLPRPARTVAAEPAPRPAPAQSAARAADTAFVGTLSAIAAVLGSRLLLMLSVIGGFVLSLQAGDMLRFYVMIAYSILIVVPLVVMDILSFTRRGR